MKTLLSELVQHTDLKFWPKEMIGQNVFGDALFRRGQKELVRYHSDVGSPETTETTSDRYQWQNEAIEAAQFVVKFGCRDDVGDGCPDWFKLRHPRHFRTDVQR